MHVFCMHSFNVTHLLTDCSHTYYFSFWFLLKYSLKTHTHFIQRGLRLTAPCTLDIRHCTIFRLGNTSSTRPDFWPLSSPDLTLVYCKMWDVIQQRVRRLMITTRSSVREHLTWHKPQHNWQYSWLVARSSLITCTEKLSTHEQRWCDSINIRLYDDYKQPAHFILIDWSAEASKLQRNVLKPRRFPLHAGEKQAMAERPRHAYSSTLVCRVGDYKGWVILRQKFRSKVYVLRQYL